MEKYVNEYWYARELQEAPQYKEWRKFEETIKKVMSACENTGNSAIEQFVGADKSYVFGNRTRRLKSGYKLTGYAYLKRLLKKLRKTVKTAECQQKIVSLTSVSQ